MTGQLVSGVRLTGREVAWWLGGTGRLLWGAPRWALLWLAGSAGAVWAEAWPVLAALVIVVLLPALWCRLAPTSYDARVREPLWRRRVRKVTRRSWPTLMEACGLARRVPLSTGATGLHVPTLLALDWVGGQLVAIPQLLVGQTVDDVQDAAERLRVAVGARQVRVVPNSAATGCQVRWMFTDPLAAPFDAVLPTDRAPVQLDTAVMGRAEDGGPWRLPLRVSTLVAGSPGAGKASAMWGLMSSLGPAIKAGLVQVHGIDLKGGMELAMGRSLFTRYATTLPEAVVLLEDAAAALQARARLIAGLVRTHEPTEVDPLVVVLVDELAALTAYATDRDLLRRADAALRVLLSQGRAPGFYVYGFLQDPRKDTVPMRHLFPQAFGLRLREREEVAMVLSDGAVHAGALCHKIPLGMPGVGYVLDEEGRVVRVRVGYVPDAMIRALAARFPAPRQDPVLVPEPDQNPGSGRAPRARSSRRPRGTGTEAAGSSTADSSGEGDAA